jgi:hypothetical protein
MRACCFEISLSATRVAGLVDQCRRHREGSSNPTARKGRRAEGLSGSGPCKHWRQIDNVLQSYRNDPALRAKLTGLRLIPVSDFDADSESQRQWMETHLEEKIKQDLVFGIVFGQLTAHDFSVFMDHEGPTGLKFAILEEVCSRGLEHIPTFKKRMAIGATIRFARR